MEVRMANRRNTRNVYNYKMLNRRGRIVKYGITNNPIERASENVQDGLGAFMEVTGGPVTRKTARRRESSKIKSYRSRYGRRPRGNKQG